MTGLFWLIFGIVFALVMVAVGVGLVFVEKGQKSKMFRRLAKPRPDRQRSNAPRVPVLAEIGGPNKRSPWERIAGIEFLTRQLAAADLEWNARGLALAMAALAVTGAVVGSGWRVLIYTHVSSIGLAAILGSLPYLYVVRKKNARRSGHVVDGSRIPHGYQSANEPCSQV
jgi:hypothetical protein